MRRLLLIFIPIIAQGAFNPGMVWNVKTTGNVLNGGGFDPTVAAPGTNFSLQDAAQQVYTDIVVGATTTQGTSVLFPFGSTLPGNTWNITGGAGCTVQRVEAISLSGTTLTFDKSLGTAASVCTGIMGGAFLTNANAALVAINSNVVYVQSGTYTLTTTLAWTTGVKWIGYGTTQGDAGTKPLITTATNSTDLVSFAANADTLVQNISFSNTAATQANGFKQVTQSNNTRMVVSNCIFDGFTNAINSDNVGAHWTMGFLFIDLTEIKNSTITGVTISGSAIWVYRSWIHNTLNGGNGIDDAQAGAGSRWTIRESTFSNNAGAGVRMYIGGTVGCTFDNNNFVSNTSHGLVANNCNFEASNNIFWNNTGCGISGGGAAVSTTQYINLTNAYGSNTGGNLCGGLVTTGDIALSVSPFTSSSVFTLNNTAGGGAALKAAGSPGVTPAGTGYLDVSALQSRAAVAQAASSAFVQ
jgi:hypothetical protein